MCIYVDIQLEETKFKSHGNSDANVASNCVDDTIEGEFEDKPHEHFDDIQGMELSICVLTEYAWTKKLTKLNTYVDIQPEDNKSEGDVTNDANTTSNCVNDIIEDELKDKDYENFDDIQGIKLSICSRLDTG